MSPETQDFIAYAVETAQNMPPEMWVLGVVIDVLFYTTVAKALFGGRQEQDA